MKRLSLRPSSSTRRGNREREREGETTRETTGRERGRDNRERERERQQGRHQTEERENFAVFLEARKGTGGIIRVTRHRFLRFWEVVCFSIVEVVHQSRGGGKKGSVRTGREGGVGEE